MAAVGFRATACDISEQMLRGASSDPAGGRNLTAEGIPAGTIELTGNTLVEATLGMLPDEAAARDIAAGWVNRAAAACPGHDPPPREHGTALESHAPMPTVIAARSKPSYSPGSQQVSEMRHANVRYAVGPLPSRARLRS